MRKDIQLHIQTGDVAIDPQNKSKFRPFVWVEQPSMLSRYIYADIDVPYTVSERIILTQGIAVSIPYTPIYKEFKVRIRRVNDEGVVAYVTNPVDGSQWFLVRSNVYGQATKNVFASTLPSISEEGFLIMLQDGIAQLYSCTQSDFNIVKAGRQNANCLLACFPGGNYRYPLTGVGLARWVNSNNVESTSLTKVLQDEFSADGVSIKNAAFNYTTKQMELDAKDLEV